MRHPVFRALGALGSVVLVLALVGCAGGSTRNDSSARPGTATSEQPEANTADATPKTYPPAPSDVSGMRGWFTESYPDAPWLPRIKSIDFVAGEVPDSGGYSDAIVIKTDLDFQTEQGLGKEIAAALGEAHPAWARQFIVWFADGNNMHAGDIFDATP